MSESKCTVFRCCVYLGIIDIGIVCCLCSMYLLVYWERWSSFMAWTTDSVLHERQTVCYMNDIQCATWTTDSCATWTTDSCAAWTTDSCATWTTDSCATWTTDSCATWTTDSCATWMTDSCATWTTDSCATWTTDSVLHERQTVCYSWWFQNFQNLKDLTSCGMSHVIGWEFVIFHGNATS